MLANGQGLRDQKFLSTQNRGVELWYEYYCWYYWWFYDVWGSEVHSSICFDGSNPTVIPQLSIAPRRPIIAFAKSVTYRQTTVGCAKHKKDQTL